MPSKKPNPSLRRAPRARPAKDELARKLALERIERRHERPNDAIEDEPQGRGIVKMPGRALADGTRRGARVMRRITLYLPLEVADELTDRARRKGVTYSDVAAEALIEHWGITAGAAE